jgi:calcium-translocating P-type ATPase
VAAGPLAEGRPEPATADLSVRGLDEREAERRLLQYGPNELARRGGARWPRELARQVAHPLALLLWGAAVLSFATGSNVIGFAVVAVVVLNAGFAFVQERHAERALEALAQYLPQQATVIRDGRRTRIEARFLVPGDLLVLGEGDRISADARLIDGELEVDMSALTGESVPVTCAAGSADAVVSSGTICTGGNATGVVLATGMSTELGRIAALSTRVHSDESPLEREVRRVAWVIASVAIGAGAVFLLLGVAAAGLPFSAATIFAVGLIVANVPEGLLPTITLSLAAGVRLLARRGALVKRLSAVETLGSTTVICTDKTGTLTQNKMEVAESWGPDEAALKRAAAACTNAELEDGSGDPMELALLRWGGGVRPPRVREYRFSAALKLMSTLDLSDGGVDLHTKGAAESVVPLTTLTPAERGQAEAQMRVYAERGLRVVAVAQRRIDGEPPDDRAEVERELEFLGLVALLDPPRPEVPDAVARCHEAGIRILVISGDHGLTTQNIARRVGIGADRVVEGADVDAMSEVELNALLRGDHEIVFARSSPETKLRIADVLRDQGEVVAMTGDGVNDAPALRRAHIGIAMGRSGTDVAREAATMVLTDDNFATIVTAVEEGRRVYANVRKFIFYIFVHATPEVVPFLIFALSGGLIPLPLLVQQILAIDLGTETLPALALGREASEPGTMQRPPRPRGEGVIRRDMLVRAWFLLGGVSAGLAMLAFFAVLLAAGWRTGDPVGQGAAFHHAYLQATSATFLTIVACQVGTALAARTDRASLASIGVLSNKLLVWGIAFELVFAAVVTAVPGVNTVFGAATPPWWLLVGLLAAPVIVWGVDELHRARLRERSGGTRGAARFVRI